MLADDIDNLEERICSLISKQEVNPTASREAYIRRLTARKWNLINELNRQKAVIGNNI
ncbi:hypothetical protein [Enterococcus sp. AZ180]|uniref:hypothetical protein n=1 Tax=Enterococcus sp. AZ180 TaxID=2774961 RepID=UPI003F20F9DE